MVDLSLPKERDGDKYVYEKELWTKEELQCFKAKTGSLTMAIVKFADQNDNVYCHAPKGGWKLENKKKYGTKCLAVMEACL